MNSFPKRNVDIRDREAVLNNDEENKVLYRTLTTAGGELFVTKHGLVELKRGPNSGKIETTLDTDTGDEIVMESNDLGVLAKFLILYENAACMH